jgi:hypothetical protein
MTMIIDMITIIHGRLPTVEFSVTRIVQREEEFESRHER